MIKFGGNVKKGHEWDAIIGNRMKGYKCPYCVKYYPSEEYNLLINNPKLCEEWDYNKNEKNPKEYTPNSAKRVYWICNKCGFGWKASIHNRNKK